MKLVFLFWFSRTSMEMNGAEEKKTNTISRFSSFITQIKIGLKKKKNFMNSSNLCNSITMHIML